MPLKDLLKKKERIDNDGAPPMETPGSPPGFTFMRTTTDMQEIIEPPSHPSDQPEPVEKEKRKSPFRRHSNAHSNASPNGSPSIEPKDAKQDRRISDRFHIHHRSKSSSSVNVPSDLPDLPTAARNDEDEGQWEKRATVLAQGNSVSRPGSSAANVDVSQGGRPGLQRTVSVADEGGDINIQEAIRLHEAGNLEKSTQMFGQLAAPTGANNALAQVLYGLALRHGWGCTSNQEMAVTYLSYAASNSARIEELALQAGMKKGGAAKGELVLAMYELAVCYRNGWGIKKDPVAAQHYFETAANLGDTDAMNEVSWCYMEGFGCKKDKFKAAQYLRLAESKGAGQVGNSWIWKDKYNPKE